MRAAGLPRRARAGLALAAVAATAAAAYAPALSAGFVSDDAVLISANPAVRSVRGALEAFGRSYWSGLKSVAPYYRPLPVLSFALERSAAGARPAAHHATNVLLHAGCAALAALLVLACARRAAPAGGAAAEDGALAGAAFAGFAAAVHPIHSEPVAAIYGRPDLLAAFFALAFLNLALRGRRLAALACLAAALFSKESAAGMPLLAPFAFAAGEGSPRREGGSPRRGGWILPAACALAILAGYLALRHHALGAWLDPSAATRLDNPLVAEGPAARRLTPVAVAGRYAALWLGPSVLCADRGFDTVPEAASWTDAWVLGGLAVLAPAAAGVIALAARRSPWGLPLAGALLAYLPGSNLLFLAPVLMAERLVYLPSILLGVLAGAAYASLCRPAAGGDGRISGWPFGRAGMHAVAAVLILLAAGRTFLRARDFRDDLTLHAATAAACPRSAKAHYNLGNALSRARRDAEAVESFRAAVEIAPWLAVAHNNMGTSFLNLRRLKDAELAYRRAAEEAPWLVNPHANLAMVLYLEGRLEEAREEGRAALALGPSPEDALEIQELVRRIERRLPPP